MEIYPHAKSLLPIDWLPPETIIEILQVSLPFEVEDHSPWSGHSPNSGFARSYFGQLWNLRRVCKTWLSVIDGTPSFWPAVSSQVPRHINTDVLLRSSSRPLTVYYTDPDPSIKPDDPELLELMTPARTSWKALAIKSAETMSFHNWLDAPAPNVEKIQLAYSYGNGIMANRPVLLGGKSKNVREVSIAGVALLWSADMFNSLRVLNLRGPGLNIGMEHILSFLSQSPSLEILCLTNAATHVWTPDTTRHPIALPQLRTLDISEAEEGVTRGLFRHITPPPLLTCLRVHFPMVVMSNIELLLTESSACLHPVLRSIHRAASGSTFLIHHRGLHWSVNQHSRDGKDPSIHLIITRASTSFACAWVDQALQSDGRWETGVELYVRGSPNLDEPCLSSLGSMRCVTKLKIRALPTHFQTLLRLLGGDYGFGTSAPSLPNLQELQLVGSHWEVSGLLPAVRRRFSARINSPDGPPDLKILIVSSSQWPGTLSFPIMDLATVMAIRAVQGVRSLSFILDSNKDGKPAIAWNDELAAAAWGGSGL